MSWKRAFQRSPCPICGKLGWCTATDDGKVVNCPRTPNDKPIVNTKTGEVIGYRWPVGADVTTIIRATPAKEAAAKLSLAEIELKHRQCSTAVNPNRVKVHARQLGVSVESLQSLFIGWDTSKQAWTFPMYNAVGRIMGLRYRRDDGAKWSLAGGSEGIFAPPRTRPGPIIVCEGPTSAAAWLTIGCDVIGRPSCSGGISIITELARRLSRRLVIVADRDSRKARPDGSAFWPGQDGARALNEQLRGICDSTWAVCPVPKDGRDWLNRGATRATVEEWIEKHVGRGTFPDLAHVKRSA